METDYIDLMLIHWPCVTAAENALVWEVLEQAVAAKQLKAIGVSNFKPTHLTALAKTQKIGPVVNQCEMNVGKTTINNVGNVDTATIAYGKAHGITYEAYSALQGGGIENEKVKAIAAAHGVAAAGEWDPRNSKSAHRLAHNSQAVMLIWGLGDINGHSSALHPLHFSCNFCALRDAYCLQTLSCAGSPSKGSLWSPARWSRRTTWRTRRSSSST